MIDLWRRDILPTSVAAILVLLLVDAVLSGVALRQQNTIRDNQHTIAASQSGGCRRLQIVRDDLNSLNSRIYRIVALSAGSPGRKPGELKRLFKLVEAETPATADVLRRFTRSTGSSLKLYDEILSDTVYLPPTDCAAARSPTYAPPEPVPFSVIADCYDPIANPRPTACSKD